jgi:hypothetical protein
LKLSLVENLPVERAVFLLREGFDYGYDEIAAGCSNAGPSRAECGSESTGHLWARRRRKSKATRDFVVERVTRVELA